MSNSRKAQAKPGQNKSLDQYVGEVKGTPFRLPVGDDHVIEIPRPSTDAMWEAEEAYHNGTSKDVIKALCGGADTPLAEELLGLLGPLDATVTAKIAEDMQEHFQLGN